MKVSAALYSLAAVLAPVSVSASDPYWNVTALRTLTTTSTTLASSLHFTFDTSSLVTECQFLNAPGSARPPTVSSPTPCDNNLVTFTYIQTSDTTGQIAVNVTYVNGAGNTQGVQSGTAIADLACEYDAAESGTMCYAQSTEIIPGAETA